MSAIRFFAAFWVACCIGATVQATSVRPPQFNDLVARADCVVRAETIATRSEWRGQGATRRIVTLVTIHVLKHVVGPSADTIELEFLGGTVDGRTLTVTDQPKFEPGNRDILFIEKNGRQFCPLVAMMYGRYPVVSDPSDASHELVARENRVPLLTVEDVSHPIAAAAGEGTQAARSVATSPLSVDDFETRIRQAAASLGRKDLAP